MFSIPLHPQRIMIFGRSGSGKSVFSQKLQQLFPQYPLYHLDKSFFVDNWQERPTADFLRIQQQFVDQSQWIIDGNSIRSLEMRYVRADLVIYFLMPRWLCLWRILKRRFCHNHMIDDRAPNCPDRLNWRLIKYTWQYEKRVASTLEDLQERYPDTPLVKVHNDKETRKLLEFWKASR